MAASPSLNSHPQHELDQLATPRRIDVSPELRQFRLLEHAVEIALKDRATYASMGREIREGRITSLDQLKDGLARLPEPIPLHRVIFAFRTVPGLIYEAKAAESAELDQLLNTTGTNAIRANLCKAPDALLKVATSQTGIQLNKTQLAQVRKDLLEHHDYLPLRRWILECRDLLSAELKGDLVIGHSQSVPFIAAADLPWIDNRTFRNLEKVTQQLLPTRSRLNLSIEVSNGLISLSIFSATEEKILLKKLLIGIAHSKNHKIRFLRSLSDPPKGRQKSGKAPPINALKKCSRGSGAVTHLLYGFGPIDYTDLFGPKDIVVANPPYLDFTSDSFNGPLAGRRLILPIDLVNRGFRTLTISIPPSSRDSFVKSGNFEGAELSLSTSKPELALSEIFGTVKINSLGQLGPIYNLNLGGGFKTISSLGSRQREGIRIRSWLLKVDDGSDPDDCITAHTFSPLDVSRYPIRPEIKFAGLFFDLGKTWENSRVVPELIEWNSHRYIGFRYPDDPHSARVRRLYEVKKEDDRFEVKEINSATLGKWA